MSPSSSSLENESGYYSSSCHDTHVTSFGGIGQRAKSKLSFVTQGIHLFVARMPILIFVQVAIMTRYVKGFKVDREMVANVVGATDKSDL
jgi:hypothetical protein